MSKRWITIVLGLLALALIWSGASIYPDWLWFSNLGFSPVYWTMFFSSFGFGLLVALLLLIIIGLNLYAARHLIPDDESNTTSDKLDNFLAERGLTGRNFNILLIGITLYICYIVVSSGSRQWDMILRFFYQQSYGSADPIFGRDIGFYLFSLPFYNFVQNGLLILIVLAGLVTLVWYLKKGGLQIIGELSQTETGKLLLPEITIAPGVKKHLSFLGGIIVLLLAWGYYLKIYGILYSTQGPAFGASYTDVQVKVLAFKVLIFFSIGFALILFLNAFKFRKKFILVSGGIWIGAVLVIATLLPIAVQKIVVKPNELTKESPYIAHNIEFTRKAYNLNKIKEVDFQVDDKLSAEEIKQHDDTIRNIRIWDERPLLQTYRQIQSIRLYYDFNNVDVDRYTVNNQYRQVMLAARELVVDQLPPQANTWVNRHLIYTHGYGLALSPVNEVTSEGLPSLLVKDLPPSYESGLEIDRPEIYYGEKTDGFVLVQTKAKEFDYPKGDTNVYSIYQGSGGVPVNSFFKRFLFALEFLDPQILFTEYLSPESRIMFNRQINKRTRLVAPFLDYDGDPYLVISEGKLYWIQDAYTTSDMYPYSVRSYSHFGNKGLNYIRNSVKITIDAYNGKMNFYKMDEEDPILKTYANIFPDLFKSFQEMPADLKKHIRYPKDLFKIQVDTYAKYHMEDIQVFYNQEDLWQIPDELYGDSRQEMEPYYIILKLPNEKKEEFFLMLPYTPSQKDNMIGWLAARSDLPNYGNLLVYKLSKEKLVFGPMQIEARVDQQTEISRELSLWGQGGSRVIRGNLLAIPISNTFIYVEPVYLEAIQEASETAGTGSPQAQQRASSKQDRARSAALPELKRIIVAFGNRLVMEENLDKALNSVLGEQVFSQQSASASFSETQDISDLGILALEYYNKAKNHLRQGRWAEYGRELENLEKVLLEISNLKQEQQ